MVRMPYVHLERTPESIVVQTSQGTAETSADVSSEPLLSPGPVSFRITRAGQTRAEMTLSFTSGDQENKVTLLAADVPL